LGKHDKIKARVESGTSNANVSFDEMCAMLQHEGFNMRISASSHHIFTHQHLAEIINLQPQKDGKAKPYQVRQVASLLRVLKKQKQK